MSRRFFFLRDLNERRFMQSQRIPYLFFSDRSGGYNFISYAPGMPPEHKLCEIEEFFEYRHALHRARSGAKRLNGSPYYVRQIELWSLDESIIQKAIADGLLKITGTFDQFEDDNCCLELAVHPRQIAIKYGLQYDPGFCSFSPK